MISKKTKKNNKQPEKNSFIDSFLYTQSDLLQPSTHMHTYIHTHFAINFSFN